MLLVSLLYLRLTRIWQKRKHSYDNLKSEEKQLMVLPQFFQLLTRTSWRKSFDTTEKSALKLEKLPKFKLKWYVLSEWRCRRLYGGRQLVCVPNLTNVCQTFCDLRCYILVSFHKSLSNLLILEKGSLSSSVYGFSLTCPCQKFKKPW